MALIADVQSWTLNIAPNIVTYGASGETKRVMGTEQCTATVVALGGQTGHPVADEGATGTLTLNEDGTYNWAFPAMLASIRPNVDIDTGDIIGYTYEFHSTGALTQPVSSTQGRQTVLSASGSTVDWT